MISKENIIEKIIVCSPWTEQFDCKLRDYGFQNPKKAWNGFTSLAKCVNFKKLYPVFFSNLFFQNVFVLNEFFQMSEPPIHFSNASGRFLSISDEFSGDHRPLVDDHDR